MQQTMCNPRQEFYKYLREIKQKPMSEKADYTFQISGIIWGNLNVIMVAVLIGAVFHKHAIDFIKDRFDFKILRKGK